MEYDECTEDYHENMKNDNNEQSVETYSSSCDSENDISNQNKPTKYEIDFSPRIRKTSVKDLATRFSTDSLDDNNKTAKDNNEDLSHIPEDLRQFFQTSPQRHSNNDGNMKENFTDIFRSDT